MLPGGEIIPADVGAALRALVAPTAPTLAAANSVSSSFSGRAPVAAPFLGPTAPHPSAARDTAAMSEVVRTSSEPRSSGGGFEIPEWFEAAARKMMADKGGSDDRLGLPELTLIGAAAQSSTTRLAADKGEGVSSLAATATAGSGGGDDKAKEDLYDLAREIYDEISRLSDIARQRSGE
jgi:hypothetical protein